MSVIIFYHLCRGDFIVPNMDEAFPKKKDDDKNGNEKKYYSKQYYYENISTKVQARLRS